MTAGRSRVLVVMGVSALLASSSNLLLRYAMGQLSAGEGSGGTVALLLAALVSPLVLTGLFGYGLSQLLWLNVLSEARLGAAFPVFMSAIFVGVMAGSILVLGEPATTERLLGGALVLIGIIVAEWSREPEAIAEEGR